MKRIKNLKGFTLVEILVVISIIGILIAISLFGIQGARLSTRDTKRKADMQQIASALELFKSDCGYYPASFPAAGTAFTSTIGGAGNCPLGTSANTYLPASPADPVPSQTYVYQAQPGGCTDAGPTRCTGYKIWTTLEGTTILPAICTTPPSCPSTACNFCVLNP